jgi:WD40 repeat protein
VLHTLTGHADYVAYVAYNKDGTLLASASDTDILIWNTSTYQLIQTINTGHSDVINSVHFSVDGKLVSASDDFSAKIWSCP